MPSFYSKHLGPTLAEKLEEIIQRPLKEHLQLHEEIAIARLAAVQALRLCQPALNGDPKVTPELMTLSINTLQEAMKSVAHLVEAASRIERNAEDKVSINVLNLFVMQITASIYDVLGKDRTDLAREIEAKIRETVRLPKDDRASFDANVLVQPAVDRLTSAMDEVTATSGPESSVEE